MRKLHLFIWLIIVCAMMWARNFFKLPNQTTDKDLPWWFIVRDWLVFKQDAWCFELWVWCDQVQTLQNIDATSVEVINPELWILKDKNSYHLLDEKVDRHINTIDWDKIDLQTFIAHSDFLFSDHNWIYCWWPLYIFWEEKKLNLKKISWSLDVSTHKFIWNSWSGRYFTIDWGVFNWCSKIDWENAETFGILNLSSTKLVYSWIWIWSQWYYYSSENVKDLSYILQEMVDELFVWDNKKFNQNKEWNERILLKEIALYLQWKNLEKPIRELKEYRESKN